MNTLRPARPRPRKRFGQHFLEAAWARKVVAAIAPAPGDVFLEIGPGTGALTLPLAGSGAPILAVELDRDLAAALTPRVPPNVTIVTGDVLATDVLPILTGLVAQRPPDASAAPPARFRVVGNLPYNLSTPILFHLLDVQQRTGLFSDATIMLQREVADRLVAAPGRKDYGVLTVLIGLHADVTRLVDLPPGAFRPAPKVHSAVVRLRFRPADVRIADPARFERLVKRLFMQRRKTLANALKPVAADAASLLASAGIDGRRRPETLTLAELARLADAERLRPGVL